MSIAPVLPTPKLAVVVVGAVATAIFVGAFVLTLRHNAALKVQAETQAQAVAELERQAMVQLIATKEAAVQLAIAKEKFNKAMAIFQKHNLAWLAAQRPDTVARLMNRATAKVFTEIEEASALPALAVATL